MTKAIPNQGGGDVSSSRRPLQPWGSAIPHKSDPLPVIPLITERPRRLIKRALKMPPCPVCGATEVYCDCGWDEE